jgi:uncharacterized cupredoxin-like copper-binding protein
MMNTILFGSLFGILAVWITGFIATFRKQLTCMVGMMAAMALGMTVGLAMGTLLTVWLPGQFFQSTLISMFVGGGIGIIAGAPISVMAVMDGLLSGIMGGMMGTMLMVMMPVPYAGIMVKIMSVLCSGIVFLIFLMLQGEIKTDSDSEYSGHTHNLSSKQIESGDILDKELLVRAMEFSFTPSSIRVIVGRKIRITLDNAGQVEHDFEIAGTNVHIHAASGQQSSMVVSFDKAGYYQVICTLPGHKEAGMTASIHVANY